MQEISQCYLFCPTPVIHHKIYDSLVLAVPPDKIVNCESFSKLLGHVSRHEFRQALVILEKSPMSEYTFDALRKEVEQKHSHLLVYDAQSNYDIFNSMLDVLYPQKKDGGFVCTLPSLPISHVLHILSQTGVHGIFEIQERLSEKTGYLKISHNRIHAARTKDYHGLQALRAICAWKNGTVSVADPEKMVVFSREDSLKDMSTDFLLLQIMHDMDGQ